MVFFSLLHQKTFASLLFMIQSLSKALDVLDYPARAVDVDKPYNLSHSFLTVKNASQKEEGKRVGVMWLESWPGLQLLFSLTTMQKQQHYRR